MRKFIVYNWLVLAVLSIMVGVYITIFETFIKDKAYLYFILSGVFGLVFYKQKAKHKL
jgi:hypothetical protein